jgi:UDP-N-acetyl-2-amino-2-deoxyglucuronate dehydrogenase
MNVLIIGFGTAGKHYFDLLKKNKNVRNIYILDDVKLSKNKKYLQVSKKEIQDKGLQIKYAFICTPSNLHYIYAKLCLNLNINVLIEKPFVLKLKHANELIKITNKKKLKCWTALQNRHNSAAKKMISMVKNKSFGKIGLVDCTMFWHRNEKYYGGWRGKYKSDGGVLNNQAIHLLDMLIYIFGPIKHFDAHAGFDKKKLEAEDLILINFVHKNGISSSFKATTRANQDYSSALDVIGSKGRALIKGVSLNSYHYWQKAKFKSSKKYSENFILGLGPKSGMGTGHKKILSEFLNSTFKKSSSDLEISKNKYTLKVIHSIYNNIFKKKKLNLIKDKDSLLGGK